jgi:hypothetical protein
MPTSPRLPDDEAPFDLETLDRFLSSMGPEMVLVGGQALAFWMQRFGIDSEQATVSNDGDVLGEPAVHRQWSSKVGRIHQARAGALCRSSVATARDHPCHAPVGRAGVACAERGRTARRKGPARLDQEVYRLAHSRPGRQLLKEQGIDLLEALDLQRLRQLTGAEYAEQLDRVEVARDRRRRVA